jgi:hypothetical protein
MKKIIPVIFLLLIAFVITSCERPASGSSVQIPTQSSGQSNPVSTQSQLMKEIIAGTQTAMALSSYNGTPQPTNAAGTSVPGTSAGVSTATSIYPSPTPLNSSGVLAATTVSTRPTLTPGPPPIVNPTYIGGSPSNNAASFIITKVVQDWTVTIQTDSLFPANNSFTVRIGPYGTNGVNGIIVGFTNSNQGGNFTATYTIPDALRGASQLAIRMDGELGYYAYNWFWNTTTQ